MTLLGLPPAAFAVGLAGLAAGLLALHLLRIRLRRQTVDSLLFFRQVGAVHKPRVLLGRPARWLSFALGLLLLAALWTAFAEPRDDADGPSRVLLLDATVAAPAGSPVAQTLADRARTLVDTHGVGPRGRVVAFGAETRTVWSAGEPLDRLAERVAALRPGGGTDAVWDGLGAAARTLEAGDEIVVLGGPRELPAEIGGVPVRRAEAVDSPAGPAIVTVGIRDGGAQRALAVEATTGGGAGTVRALLGTTVLAEAALTTAPGATAVAVLAPLPEVLPGPITIEVTAASGTAARTAVELPGRRTLTVHAADTVPAAVRVAIAADPRAEPGPADTADVLVVAATPAPPPRPALVVDPGVGSAPRTPRRLPACPLPLGLRDRARTAPALADAPGEVWVEDAATGAALVRREGPHLRVVSWLLDDPTHRDVPALILGAVHELAGATPVTFGPLAAPAPAGAATPLTVDDRPGSWPWVMLLLALGFVALCADAWLHHRGRVA